MFKRKFNILQTNSKLFYAHIYSYHFISGAREGVAEATHVSSRPRFCCHSGPSSSGAEFISYVASGQSPAPPSGRGGAVMTTDGEGARGRQGARPALRSSRECPCVRRAFWQVRSRRKLMVVFHAFVFGSLQF